MKVFAVINNPGRKIITSQETLDEICRSYYAGSINLDKTWPFHVYHELNAAQAYARDAEDKRAKSGENGYFYSVVEVEVEVNEEDPTSEFFADSESFDARNFIFIASHDTVSKAAEAAADLSKTHLSEQVRVYALIKNPNHQDISTQEDMENVLTSSFSGHSPNWNDKFGICKVYHKLEDAKAAALWQDDRLVPKSEKFSVVEVKVERGYSVVGSYFNGGMCVFSKGFIFQASHGNFAKAAPVAASSQGASVDDLDQLDLSAILDEPAATEVKAPEPNVDRPNLRRRESSTLSNVLKFGALCLAGGVALTYSGVIAGATLATKVIAGSVITAGLMATSLFAYKGLSAAANAYSNWTVIPNAVNPDNNGGAIEGKNAEYQPHGQDMLRPPLVGSAYSLHRDRADPEASALGLNALNSKPNRQRLSGT